MEQLQSIFNQIAIHFQSTLEKERLYYRPEDFKQFFSSSLEVPHYFISPKERNKIEFWMNWTRDRLEGLSVLTNGYEQTKRKERKKEREKENKKMRKRQKNIRLKI
jgi:hypothetical protein